jgi:predicted TIM-barrel fold metal-dependent hydrolase
MNHLTVDCHAHWIPPTLAAALRERTAVPRIEQSRDGEVFVTYQGRRPFAPLGDLDRRLELMERNGISAQVLSLAGLFGIDCLAPAEALPLVRMFNDAVAELQRADIRFAALAALPVSDVELACRELARAQSLEVRGAILPADAFASLSAAERFRPLFELANQHKGHFFIHPGPLQPPPERLIKGARTDNAWQRRIVLETQARLSEVMVTLALSDFADAYVNVTLQVANLGGGIPFFVERMDAVHRDVAPEEPPPSKRLRRCYVDTASFGPRAIDLAVACFGADRVLLGTDCPIFDAAAMIRAVADANLDARSRDLLLNQNARRLLQRA